MRHAAFVRAVMVGRDGLHRTILLEAFEQAGAGRPRSYITTGNVTFDAAPRSVPAITDRIEAALEAVVGRRTEVYVRSIPYLEDLVASGPYEGSPVSDAVEHEVSFLYEPIDATDLAVPIVSPGGHLTIVGATDHEVFCVGREVDGRRKGAGGFVERIVGQRITTRAWSTVLRLATDPEPRNE